MKYLEPIKNSQTAKKKRMPLLRSSCSVLSFNNSFKHDGAIILDASSPHTAEPL